MAAFEDYGLPGTTPNILFVFTDQQQNRMWQHFNPAIITPHLNQLASEGTVFSNCITNYPVCTPFRGNLLMSQYPRITGVTCNDVPLPLGTGNTWGEVMQAQGYRTAFFGKWHLSAGRPEGRAYVPASMRAGFETWKASECHHIYRSSSGSYYYDESDVKHIHPKYQPESEADHIISFIQDHQANHSGSPFFCMWAPNPPHDPFSQYDNGQASPNYGDYYPLVDSIKPPNFGGNISNGDMAGYYTMCTGLDNAFGRVLDELNAQGLTNNTIVVFTSDHGEMLGAHGLRLKMKPWEESVNTPMVVRYPGVVPAGRETDALFSTLDFMPSLMSLAGLNSAIPSGIQGKDLSLTLRGQAGEEHDEVFIAITDQRHMGGQTVTEPQAAPSRWVGVRTKRYVYATFEKGVHEPGYGANGGYLLFDLQEDPWEMHNLVDRPEYAALQASLWDKLHGLAKEAGELDAGFQLPDRPTPQRGNHIKLG